MEKSNLKVALFTITFLLFFVGIAQAANDTLTAQIGGGRVILYPEVGVGGAEISKYFTVNNVNAVPVNISLETAGDLKDMIKLETTNFILQPGENKRVNYVIKLKNAENIEGKVNVYFSQVGKKGGVAVSATIIVHPTKIGIWDSFFGKKNSTDDGSDSGTNNNSTGSNGGFVDMGKISTGVILGLVTFIMFIVVIILLVLLSNKKKRKLNLKENDWSS